MRRAAVMAVLALVCCTGGMASTTTEPPSEVDLEGGAWTEDMALHYVITIAGRRAGLMGLVFLRREAEGHGTIYKTEEYLDARIARGSDTVALQFRNIVVEDAAGRVLVGGYKQRMAVQEVLMRYNYLSTPGAVAVTSVSNGAQIPSTVESSGAHGRRYMFNEMAKLFSDGASPTLTMHVVKPEMGPQDRETVCTLVGTQRVFIPGMSADAADLRTVYEVNEEIDGMPIKVMETFFYDADVAPMPLLTHYAVESPMGRIEADIATEHDARAALVDDGTALPELVHSTYVPLARREDRLWRPHGRVAFRVATKDGSKLTLPGEGYQSVARVSADVVRATQNTHAPELNTMSNAEVNRIYLSKTAMIDGTDAEVMKLARKVVKRLVAATEGPPTPSALAYAARALTRATITTSNLATGFASATETARTRSGDCSEHAVLLAAILRALRLPSRTCSGLVYIEDRRGPSLGWHMWTQVLLPGDAPDTVHNRYWHDLDATLHGMPYSLGHVLFGTSAMTDAEAHTGEIRIVSMIGNLDVSVDVGDEADSEVGAGSGEL